MKKGQIFMPIVIIGLLIIMSVFIFTAYTHQKKSQEYYSIGFLQSNIIKNAYLGSEKVFFNYEKKLEYNEYKSIKEFSENGGVQKKCNKRWNFKTDCNPAFKEDFKEILTRNLGENKKIEINSKIEVYFTDFNFPTSFNNAKIKYEAPIIIKKKPLINFKELEQLKNCLETDKLDNCNPESNSGDIYKFKKEMAEILNENLEKEKIFLEFEIDNKNYKPKIF